MRIRSTVVMVVGCFIAVAVAAVAYTAYSSVFDNKHLHEWGAWVLETAPTCVADGKEVRTCALDIGHTETRAVAAEPTAHAPAGRALNRSHPRVRADVETLRCRFCGGMYEESRVQTASASAAGKVFRVLTGNFL